MLNGSIGKGDACFKYRSVTGDWKRLHDEPRDLYISPNVIRVIKSRRAKWVGRVARVEERRFTYTGWWGNLEENPLRILGRRWEDNIKVDVREICLGTRT
jgi:hypothetical protein